MLYRCESANSPPEIIVRGTIIPKGQGSYGPLSLGIIVLTGHSELDVDNYSNMYLIMIVIGLYILMDHEHFHSSDSYHCPSIYCPNGIN